MADYYVMYNGTQYDVADFAAGVAKAKELGSSAVLYANTALTEAATWHDCSRMGKSSSGGVRTTR